MRGRESTGAGPVALIGTGQAFFAGLFATQVFDGHAYGLPWYVDARLLFYRQDRLAEAGGRLQRPATDPNSYDSLCFVTCNTQVIA